VATSQELNEELSRDIDKIDMIQKNLDKYLTMKKTNFARLYFLSDDELLKILSNTKDPRNVNDYLRKIFENMD
jgi:dynein heavy chain